MIELARDFLKNKISAEDFSEMIVLERRKLYNVEEPDKMINSCAGELFIVADCYNPDADRASSELDEAELRVEVEKLLREHHLYE